MRSVPYLVEEDILPIPSLGGKIFEVAVLADSMFLTEMLPELTSDLETRRERDDVPRARGRVCFSHIPGGSTIPLLPHWPAWIVMISLIWRVSSCPSREFLRFITYLGMISKGADANLGRR